MMKIKWLSLYIFNKIPHFTKLKSDGVGTEGGIVPLLSEES